MTSSALTCREFVELVTEYLEDALSAEERQRFEEHLRLCPGCETYLDQMRQTATLLGQVTEASLAPEAQDALLAAFKSWKAGALEPVPDAEEPGTLDPGT